MNLLRRFWTEYRGFTAFLVLMFVFRSAWADWMVVPTGSMNPTILEGDRVWVDKHRFGLRIPFTHERLTEGDAPARGEVVVFDSPADGTRLIKRVAAIPGDTIALVEERLIVNGRPAHYGPAEPALVAGLQSAMRARDPIALIEASGGRRHPILLIPGRGAPATMAPVQMPAGMYFMLGDSRDNSADSRFIGFVPRDQIVGRAERIVISLDPERYFRPRLQRTLAVLP
jgi:signal peptidase I